MISGDKYSAENLQLLWKKEKCKLLKISEKYQPKLFSKSIVNYVDWGNQKEYQPDMQGIACKTNASLTLIALDSLQFYLFAERLGMDISRCVDKTTVVIINEKVDC